MKVLQRVALFAAALAPAVSFAQSTGPDLSPLTAAIDFGDLNTNVIAGFAAVITLTILIAACTIVWKVARGAKSS
jgi:hypothetical protein